LDHGSTKDVVGNVLFMLDMGEKINIKNALTVLRSNVMDAQDSPVYLTERN
jgi:hypothetical protein